MPDLFDTPLFATDLFATDLFRAAGGGPAGDPAAVDWDEMWDHRLLPGIVRLTVVPWDSRAGGGAGALDEARAVATVGYLNEEGHDEVGVDGDPPGRAAHVPRQAVLQSRPLRARGVTLARGAEVRTAAGDRYVVDRAELQADDSQWDCRCRKVL